MTAHDDLTTAQATDLARYMLGPAWRAELGAWTRLQPDCYMLEGPHELISGTSWRDVFRQAKAWPRTRPRFTWLKNRVLDAEGKTYATAVSNTAATRIGTALNQYLPPDPPPRSPDGLQRDD
jgi:hypothetical protein